MKKAVIMIVAFCILFGAAFARAESAIVFRGMSWDTSLTDFMDQINEDVSKSDAMYLSDVDVFNDAAGLLAYSPDETEHYQGHYYPAVDAYSVMLVIIGDSFKVAGLPVQAILASAIPNDKEQPSQDDSSMVFACYHFDVDSYKDHDDLYNSLANKLTSLYGDPSIEKDKWYSVSEKLWYGDENTYCQLYALWDTSTRLSYLEIMYGKTDAPDRIEALLADVSEVDASNTDGL